MQTVVNGMNRKNSRPRVATSVRIRLRDALALLARATEYAQELDRDVWDFAIEGQELKSVGLDVNDLRWLLYQGYVAHANESTKSNHQARLFEATSLPGFGRRSCFVLTEAGQEFVRLSRVLSSSNIAVASRGFSVVSDVEKFSPAAQVRMIPCWDNSRRELYFQGELIKQFKLPSANQQQILQVFEEENWPSRIDDPLSTSPDFDPKQRLRETIRSLNRNQRARLLRFKGDGTGEGILWEPIS